MNMSPADHEEQRAAKQLLENPGLAAKLSSVLGTPVEKRLALLPADWKATISGGTQKALMVASKGAVKTMRSKT